MRDVRLAFLLMLLGPLFVIAGCSDDSEKCNCPKVENPFQTPYVAPTSPANLLFDLKLAYTRRDSVAYAALLDPGFVFAFAPQDVGHERIPEAWGVQNEIASASKLFSGVANADGYLCETISLNFEIGPDEPGDFEGWHKVTILQVTLLVDSHHETSGYSLRYEVLGDMADFQMVLTEETDSVSGEKLWKIVRWTDRPIIGKTATATATEPTTWGKIKANWR